MPVPIELKRTPLYGTHLASGAAMTPFGGWEMPLRYAAGGDKAEHYAVREKVGLFDVSHMGRFNIIGRDACEFINNMVAYDIRKVNPGQARYTVMCNPEGGIIDDLLVYRTEDPEHIALVVNAGNRMGDLDWLRGHQAGFQVKIEDETEQTALIAVQGPRSLDLIKRLTSDSFNPPEYYRFAQDVEVDGVKMLVSRTGYTGEDGVELWFNGQAAEDVWKDLLREGKNLGVMPCGLGARDSLRLEAGFALHGHEISPSINPFEANLGWVTSLDKNPFIGREALVLAKQHRDLGSDRRLTGFKTATPRAPRAGYLVFYQEQEVGHIVSGVSSPTLGVGIGTGFIEAGFSKLAEIGTQVEVGKEGTKIEAKVSSTRFYKRPSS